MAEGLEALPPIRVSSPRILRSDGACLSEQEAKSIVDEVMDVVVGWRDVAADVGVDDDTAAVLEAAIST